MALPHGKIFTVRPVVSWIDKLASQHGSPGAHHSPTFSSPSAPEPEKYQKRELALKTMQDSYTEVIYPFKSDKALLEEYINVAGSLRYRVKKFWHRSHQNVEQRKKTPKNS
jgi:acyl-coenzyme A thioesterase 9